MAKKSDVAERAERNRQASRNLADVLLALEAQIEAMESLCLPVLEELLAIHPLAITPSTWVQLSATIEKGVAKLKANQQQTAQLREVAKRYAAGLHQQASQGTTVQ